MTDEELIAALRKRADDERKIQANNEAVATALKGQRLLFDQGFRSDAITFATRLGLDYESCARNDAKLAADWDAAADRIEALVKERDCFEAALGRACQVGGTTYLVERYEAAEAKLAKAVEALREIEKRASETNRLGAVTGGHWTRLTVACLNARAALAEIDSEPKP